MCSSNVKPIKGSKKHKIPHQLKGTISDCMPCVFAKQRDQAFLQHQQASRTLEWIGNGALQALSDRTPHNSWPSSLFTLSCHLWFSSSQVNLWLPSHGLQSICKNRFTWLNTPKTSVTLVQTKHLEKECTKWPSHDLHKETQNCRIAWTLKYRVHRTTTQIPNLTH